MGMYLACLLLERGCELRKTRPKGPDLRIEGESPMWIEVIAVESGVSEDRVKTQEERRDTNASQIEGVWIGVVEVECIIIVQLESAGVSFVKATLRTNPSSEQAATISQLRLRRLPACYSRVAFGGFCSLRRSQESMRGVDGCSLMGGAPAGLNALRGLGDLSIEVGRARTWWQLGEQGLGIFKLLLSQSK